MGCRFLGVTRGGGTGGAALSSGGKLKICRRTYTHIKKKLKKNTRKERNYHDCCFSGCQVWEGGVGGGAGRTFLFSSMRISTTMFWNLMSNIAATVSSLALISVGPNTTAMLEAVIRFSSQRLHTLQKDTERQAGGFEESVTAAVLVKGSTGTVFRIHQNCLV